MDAYLGYNQIFMHLANEESTYFITIRGFYCYKMMPFEVKNAGATYRKLVNNFPNLIGKTIEVYVDDILIKSLMVADHVIHLNKTFQILIRYGMRLNPLNVPSMLPLINSWGTWLNIEA